MELQMMPRIHTPGVLGKLSCWQSAPLWAEAWRNTGVNNLPISPQTKKGKHGSLCRGLKWVPVQFRWDQTESARGLNQAWWVQLCRKNLLTIGEKRFGELHGLVNESCAPCPCPQVTEVSQRASGPCHQPKEERGRGVLRALPCWGAILWENAGPATQVGTCETVTGTLKGTLHRVSAVRQESERQTC